MFVTYHRIGRSAVLPAVAAAAVLLIVGGIAAVSAAITLAIVGVVAVGIRLFHALVRGGTERPLAFNGDNTIEGFVVNRSVADGEPGLTPRTCRARQVQAKHAQRVPQGLHDAMKK